MTGGNYFSGISGAFWGLTFALIGFMLFVASVGGVGLIRVLLAVTAGYSMLGVAYGCWAARDAVRRSRAG